MLMYVMKWVHGVHDVLTYVMLMYWCIDVLMYVMYVMLMYMIPGIHNTSTRLTSH